MAGHKRSKKSDSERRSKTVSINSLREHIADELKNREAAAIVRSPGRPKGSTAFQRVQRAKELLAESSEFAVRCVKKAAKVAAARGESAPAEFLLKHAAIEEGGKVIRPIATSVDKLEDGGSRAPTINIGWIARPELPPAQVIDVKALPAPEDS